MATTSVTKSSVISDQTIETKTVDPTVRARTIVLTGKKLKPHTGMNVFFSGTKVTSYVTPCTRIILKAPTSGTFSGYDQNAKVQTTNITERTTTVDSYDMLDRGDVISWSGGTAVVIADETVYDKVLAANKRILYVSNVKGSICTNNQLITNKQNTASATVDGTPAAGDFQTNSLGNFYATLSIPGYTFASGANNITVVDNEQEMYGAWTTKAEGGYFTQGNINTFDRHLVTESHTENTTVNTIERTIYSPAVVTTVTLPPTVRTVNAPPPEPDMGDPLSQTFTVPADFTEGCYITSVELYFAAGNAALADPVEVQIVETLNGYPTAKVLPHASTILYGDEINYNATGLTATKFTFPSLIKLCAGIEYAIKILSNSTKYRVWTSFIGDTELTNTSRIISEQPHMGSFFKSQNNSTWTPEQLQDLTFKLNYAKFNINTIGNLMLVENAVSNYHTLPSNPFRITNGRTEVAVHHPSHGLAVGLYVTYSGSTVSAFNATFLIAAVVDSDNYIITASSQASTDLVGGDAVEAEKSIKYDKILVNGIGIGRTYGIELSAKLAGATALDAVETDIPADSSVDLLAEKFVHTGINRTNHLSGASSFQLRASFSSVNDAISPVIDLDSLSVNLYGSKINNPSDAQIDYDIDGTVVVTGASNVSFTASTNNITIHSTSDYSKITIGAWIKITSGSTLNLNKTGYISKIDTTANTLTIVGDTLVDESGQSAVITQYNYVSEIANGGSAESKYISSQVNLKDTATGFRVIFDANIPTAAEIDLYYRANISSSADRLSEKTWTNHPITYKKSAVEFEFTEFEYNITNVAAFDCFQFKFVFRSTNSGATPKLKNLRIVAHG